MKIFKGCLMFVGAMVVVGVVIAVFASSGSKQTSNGTTPTAATQAHPASADISGWTVADDGIGGASIKFTITNHSSKSSDYEVQADIMTGGQRTDQVDQFENNVKPGQVVQESYPATSSTTSSTVTNVQVRRSESVGNGS